jgi:hypothetical protein
VRFINGQGTLLPNSWHNELHPTKAGFEKFADIFYRELKKLYPEPCRVGQGKSPGGQSR